MNYRERWEDTCKRMDKPDDCAIDAPLAKTYDEGLEKDKKLCLERYK